MVSQELPKLLARVRFPLPAPIMLSCLGVDMNFKIALVAASAFALTGCGKQACSSNETQTALIESVFSKLPEFTRDSERIKFGMVGDDAKISLFGSISNDFLLNSSKAQSAINPRLEKITTLSESGNTLTCKADLALDVLNSEDETWNKTFKIAYFWSKADAHLDENGSLIAKLKNIGLDSSDLDQSPLKMSISYIVSIPDDGTEADVKIIMPDASAIQNLREELKTLYSDYAWNVISQSNSKAKDWWGGIDYFLSESRLTEYQKQVIRCNKSTYYDLANIAGTEKKCD